MSFEVEQIQSFPVDLRKLDINMKRGIRQGFFKVGAQLKKTARAQMMEKPKSGRLYKIRGRKHRASAAGQSPANITGALRDSIGFQISGTDSMQFGAGGRGSGVDYASYLEAGTRKMKARPLLQNAVKKDEGKNDRLFQDAVARTLETPTNQPVIF